MNKSKIEWCDYTWNPVTGCLHGCEYCYAEKIANRFASKAYTQNKDIFAREFTADLQIPDVSKNGKVQPYPHGFKPTFHRYRLDEPIVKTKSSKIFVCSMADLFGDWVPDEWIKEVMNKCYHADQHKYLFLTKNPKRYRALGNIRCFDPHCWYGTTATNQAEANKNVIEMVHTLGKKFLSLEPLLGPINLRNIDTKDAIYNCLTGIVHTLMGYTDNRPKISWIIIGAQTGPGAKTPKTEWVQSIIDQCKEAGIPVFLKNNLNWPVKIQEFPEGLR
jgi:protein gp37